MPAVQKTALLFQKWLYFGLSTIFSSVMLGIMSEISMDLIGNISVALFTSNEAMELLTGDSASGVMYSITQQLGLGLMLSTLLIVVPPMAGMWFNGVMGQFNAYSPLTDRWNANAPVPQHIDGGRSYQQQVENRVTEARQEITNRDSNQTKNTSSINRGWTNTTTPHQSSDQFKSPSQMNTDNLK